MTEHGEAALILNENLKAAACFCIAAILCFMAWQLIRIANAVEREK